MELQTDLQSWLNLFSCPAFSAKENLITACNQAAQALLLCPGTDVRTLLLTGQDDYPGFQGGCLYLKLNLKGYGASVTRQGEQNIFLLDQEPEDAALRSLALAARELRGPLSNLMIAADGFSRTAGEDAAAQEQLARMNRSLHQLLRLVNNMSDAQRSGVLTPEGMHEWNKLLYDIFEKIRTQLASTGITLTYEGLSEPVYGLANEGQLEWAILNMLSNSMKFLPENGSIHAKLTRQKNMLSLSVEDNGSGIARQILGSVFTRYQRQPGIEDSRYGLGLGMVLIRNTASDHGGTVLIQQPEGGGTRVTMTMAIRQDASQLRSPVIPPLVDSNRQILTELSQALPWECYQQ